MGLTRKQKTRCRTLMRMVNMLLGYRHTHAHTGAKLSSSPSSRSRLRARARIRAHTGNRTHMNYMKHTRPQTKIRTHMPTAHACDASAEDAHGDERWGDRRHTCEFVCVCVCAHSRFRACVRACLTGAAAELIRNTCSKAGPHLAIWLCMVGLN